MTKPLSHWLAQVAGAHDDAQQPQATFQALDRAAAALIGHRLFTLLVCDPVAQQAQRIYSNRPDSYPLQGRKPITDTPWMRRVIQDGQPYIGRNAADIRAVFFDHELIAALDCQSVLNIALRWQGRTLGTMNLLHRQDWYQPQHIETARILGQLALPALMALPAQGRQND